MHNLIADHLKAAIVESGHDDELMLCRQDYFEFNVEATTPIISPTTSLKRKYHTFDEQTQSDDSPPNPKRSADSHSITDVEHVQSVHQQHQPTDTIEYVLFDENYLPVTQSNRGDHQMSAANSTTTTYVQYSVARGISAEDHQHQPQTDSNTDWSQVDLLDLDQRHHQWYFEETPSVNGGSSADTLDTSTGISSVHTTPNDVSTTNAVAPMNPSRAKPSTDGDLFCLRPTQVVDSCDARGSVAALSKSNLPSKNFHSCLSYF